MQFQNRLTGQISKILPAQILLGEWQVVTEAESASINTVQILESRIYLFPDANQRCSLRLSDQKLQEQVFSKWQIPSNLLLESIQFFEQKLKALIAQHESWEKWVNIPPLVHDIRETIRRQPLEELIQKHLGHIEEICHHPRTYLKMETERLPVCRAQRISPHATEFLSAHTEDWEKRTFRNVRPKRVLCLIREDLLNIYENQVTARLIDHLLEYLQKRIVEVLALQRELEQADDFSKDTHRIYWRNQKRICSLWGEQVQAETALKTAEETLKTLRQLKYKLRGLLDTDLYRAISKETNIGHTLKRTNILINDQHYRYVAHLWQAWSPWKRGQMKNAQQIFQTYQEGFKGFESFCLLLISRALTGNTNAKDNDRGLGFEIVNDCIPARGDSIEFNSLRGILTLTWLKEGTFVLSFDQIQPLRLVPLLIPLAAVAEPNILSHVINKITAPFTSKENYHTLILYPGTEEELSKLPMNLQQQINTLGNDNSAGEISLALLPVSPLELISVERTARAIQWWLCSQQYQTYPYIIEETIPVTLLEQTDWIVTEGRECKLVRPPQADEKNIFHNRLFQLINQFRAKGPVAKGELNKLNQLFDFPSQVQDKFKPLLVCPTCYEVTERFTPLDSHCFSCNCNNNSCKSVWGTKICGNCGARYPYVQLPGLNNIDLSTHQEVRWVERVFGRNSLATPYSSNKIVNNFICPSCKTCS